MVQGLAIDYIKSPTRPPLGRVQICESDGSWDLPSHNIFGEESHYFAKRKYFLGKLDPFLIKKPSSDNLHLTKLSNDLGNLSLLLVPTPELEAKLAQFRVNLPGILAVINSQETQLTLSNQVESLDAIDWTNVNHFYQFCNTIFEFYYLFTPEFIQYVFLTITQHLEHPGLARLFLSMFLEESSSNDSYLTFVTALMNKQYAKKLADPFFINKNKEI